MSKHSEIFTSLEPFVASYLDLVNEPISDLDLPTFAQNWKNARLVIFHKFSTIEIKQARKYFQRKFWLISSQIFIIRIFFELCGGLIAFEVLQRSNGGFWLPLTVSVTVVFFVDFKLKNFRKRALDNYLVDILLLERFLKYEEA